ncbi:hypothetical protein ACFYXC_12955 [Streptomyces sp. NPDC002701]|uniref:hypothetical protein n=1 Tax=Streptomyces sp. NPDC002701 TaxID=3364661 RepID=UPI003685B8DB
MNRSPGEESGAQGPHGEAALKGRTGRVAQSLDHVGHGQARQVYDRVEAVAGRQFAVVRFLQLACLHENLAELVVGQDDLVAQERGLP